MAKRFYKVNEKVWIKELKKTGKVASLDIANLSASITFYDEGALKTRTLKFMEIDKLRTEEVKPKVTVFATSKKDTVLFAKVKPSAKVPSKRVEDAGYDIYANFEGDSLRLTRGESNLVPTGIASSLLPKYYFNLKHERGSTGKWGMAILSGVVDSGYRGEWFINIVPTGFDVVISKTYAFPIVDGVKKAVLDRQHAIVWYPYEQAIAQATLDLVPEVLVKEIPYDQLKAIPSQRGTGLLGSSGK